MTTDLGAGDSGAAAKFTASIATSYFHPLTTAVSEAGDGGDAAQPCDTPAHEAGSRSPA